jgi:ABC-2 type transport system ATP-binding protein
MKTAFARSLMHDPEVLILDEYNRGLDPKASRQLREYIKTVLQGEQAKTILVMTHGMEIAEDLCDRIVLIDQGQIVAEGTSTALKATLTQQQVIEVETTEELTNGLLPQLQDIGKVEMGSDSTNVIKLLVDRDPTITHQVLDLFRSNEVEIANLNLSLPNLEDVFLHYTGKKLED